MNPLSTLINDSLQRFEEKFASLCLVNKFNEKKYWKPDACGYDPKDVEAPLDKFFPEKIAAVLKPVITQSNLSIIQAIKEKCEKMKGHPCVFCKTRKGKCHCLVHDAALSTLQTWLQEAEDLISNQR
jgi:hypothetical protein